MGSQDSERFHTLPPLTADFVARLKPGQELSLLLLDYVPNGPETADGVIVPVTYIHKELTYRTPGNKDAVAFGEASLRGVGEVRDVRILFSRPNKTATLRGLSHEGQVKIGPRFR